MSTDPARKPILARPLLLALALPTVGALLFLGGCNTVQDARAARGEGTVRFYQQPVERVWSVVPAAVTDAQLAVVEQDNASRVVLAERGLTFFSRGEKVAVFVDAKAEKLTQVEVVSKRTDKGNLTATNSEIAVLDAIGVQLDRVDRQGP